MRLAGAEKLGFYATPPKTRELIAPWLELGGGYARALDPTAGDGGPLAYLAGALDGKLETYGVEIQPDRAAAAKKALDHVLATAWENTIVSPGAFDLLFLNPPYDWDDEGKRYEDLFLASTVHKIAPGGILVFVLPQNRLNAVSRRLAGYYTDLVCRRLPDDEYEVFHQVVVFGRRKRKFARDEEAEAAIAAWRMAWDTLPTLDGSAGLTTGVDVRPYVIPATDRKRKIKFSRYELKAYELLELAAGVYPNELGDRLRPPSVDDITLTPAMPFRSSHLAQLVTAGLSGTLALTDEDGQRYLAKGKVVKKFVETGEETTVTEKGIRTRTTEREIFSLAAYVLQANGDTEEMDETKFARFLTRHAEEITAQVAGRYPPRYQFDPTEQEMAVVNRLMKGVRLPGRRETGLFAAQKHLAIAGARSAAANGYFVTVGEMGYGKTATMTAQVELLHALRGDAYPALVVCPSHLVEEWANQLPGILPGVNVVIIERTSEVDEKGAKRSVPAVAQMVRFQRAHQAGLVPEKTFVLLSKETAKLGPGWEPACGVRKSRKLLKESPRRDAKGKFRLGEVTHKFPACPTCGEIPRDSDDLPLTFDALGRRRTFCARCGSALFEYRGYRRWPVADYVRRQMKGLFGAIIGDEIHEFKAKNSIQGMALASLVQAGRYFLGGTGTLYGGTATSVYHLFYRMDPKLRHRFSFHGERRFVERYGRLEKTITETEEETSYGLQTRHRVTTKEIPGANPRLVEIVAESCGFGSIADLGYELPPYDEQVVTLQMDPEQDEQYSQLNDKLFDLLMEAIKQGDNGFASVYLQNLLCRPNSAFREEWVRRNIRIPHSKKKLRVDVLPESLPPVVTVNGDILMDPRADGAECDWLPKERWLADFVGQEAAQGRKTLVYVRQTGTRNIQPRIQAALEAVGVRARVLPASVAAKKRRAWLQKNVAGLDAVIVHPKKVATGLNLVDFSSVVFAEPDYSLYTMLQAMRRVWRPGQVRPVKVRFLVYSSTMEARALALVSSKAAAAARVIGDDVEGALAGMNDNADGLMAELLDQAIKKTDYADPRAILAAMAAGSAADGDAYLGIDADSVDDVWEAALEEILEAEAEPELYPEPAVYSASHSAPVQLTLLGAPVLAQPANGRHGTATQAPLFGSLLGATNGSKKNGDGHALAKKQSPSRQLVLDW